MSIQKIAELLNEYIAGGITSSSFDGIFDFDSANEEYRLSSDSAVDYSSRKLLAIAREYKI